MYVIIAPTIDLTEWKYYTNMKTCRTSTHIYTLLVLSHYTNTINVCIMLDSAYICQI